MQNNIMQQVKSALQEVLKLSDEAEISLQSHLKEDLGLDSMSSLTFLMTLEENIKGFVVEPDTLEMSDLETVASITRYIECQLVGMCSKKDSQCVETDQVPEVFYA